MKDESLGKAKRSFLLFCLCPLVLTLFACASAKLDVIQVGPWFEPRDYREVEVFTSRDQTRRPWGGIAILHSSHVPDGDQGGLEKLKLQARKKAAKIGADAVILAVDSVSSGSQMGVYEAPELFVSALAIKYVTAVSTPTAK